MSPVVNAPCRLGTTRILELLSKFNRNEATASDLPRLEKMLTHVTRLSACGLGTIRRKSMKSALALFQKNLKRLLKQKSMSPAKGW